MRAWFAASGAAGWATCRVTESGLVRVSSNPKALPNPIGLEQARAVLRALREHEAHRFLHDDVSLADHEIPRLGAAGSPTRTCSQSPAATRPGW